MTKDKSRRADTYQVITDRIIEQLEAGVVPWKKPWSGGLPPQNLVSGHVYRGVNVFVLGGCAPYGSPYWLTFKQTRDLGGHIKKGEKGWPITFWKWAEREKTDGSKERYGLLRRYTVFNAEAQCEGVDVPEVGEPDSEWNPIEAAEGIVRGYGDCPPVELGGFGAAYSPVHDRIDMPKPHSFNRAVDFYSTLFHEMGHSTGHKTRLSRDGVINPVRFGSHDYSREELIAEMTAAFLCGEAGIEQSTLEASASYIDGWLSKLKLDNKLVVQAAGQAQKAADWILGDGSKGEADDAK